MNSADHKHTINNGKGAGAGVRRTARGRAVRCPYPVELGLARHDLAGETTKLGLARVRPGTRSCCGPLRKIIQLLRVPIHFEIQTSVDQNTSTNTRSYLVKKGRICIKLVWQYEFIRPCINTTSYLYDQEKIQQGRILYQLVFVLYYFRSYLYWSYGNTSEYDLV